MRSNSLNLAVAALSAVAAFSTLPGIALAQGAGASAYIDDRLGQIARSIADLRSRADQLQKQNQQLQQQLEKMQSSYESRLQRLEKAGAAKTPTPRAGQSQR